MTTKSRKINKSPRSRMMAVAISIGAGRTQLRCTKPRPTRWLLLELASMDQDGNTGVRVAREAVD